MEDLDNEDLNNQIENLNSDIEDLNTEIKELNFEIKELNTEIEELNEELTIMEYFDSTLNNEMKIKTFIKYHNKYDPWELENLLINGCKYLKDDENKNKQTILGISS